MPVFTRREQYRNGGSTMLVGNITSSATSFTVADGTQLPLMPSFRVKIGTELLLVQSVAGNVCSDVIRGAEGSVPAAHSIGDTVVNAVTAMSLRALPFPGRPAFNRNKIPEISQFAQYNMSGVVSSDDAGIVITAPPRGSGFNLMGLYHAAPTPPYTVTAAFQFIGPMKRYIGFGMMWLQSGGAAATFDCLSVNAPSGPQEMCELSTRQANNPNSYAGGYLWLRYAEWAKWMRISDDGTNRKCWISEDGQYWLEFHSVARTNFINPQYVGWQVYNENVDGQNTGCICRCLSWDVVVG